MNTKTAKHVYKFSDLAISGGIIIAGILLAILIPSSSGLGICIILTGLCIFPFLKTGYRIPGQKEIFSHKEYILPEECKSAIVAYIEGKSETLDLNPFREGGLLLEHYYLRNGSRLFVQLYDFSSGVCSAQSELSEIDRGKLDEILKYQLQTSMF